jgi:hypothetical protein
VSELLDPRTINATWHVGPFAEVRVGDHVTRYVRRGTGPSVLLLLGDTEANPLWSSLIETLIAGHRVIIPQRAPDSEHSAVCLRGFIEGIGACDLDMIAGGSAIGAALEVASSDEFTVRKLILLTTASSTPEPSSERILWIPGDQSTDASMQRIEEFLRR